MSSIFNIEKSVELLEGQAHVWHQVFNFISSMSLKCAIQLGIPDIIHKHGRPMTLLELVDALKISNAKAGGLFRLMRILVHSGFFVKERMVSNEEEEVEEGYSLLPSSLLLVDGHPFSIKSFVLCQLDPILNNPWHHFSKWLQNDDHTTYQTAYNGKNFWEIKEADTEFSMSFDAGMAADTSLVSRVITENYRKIFEGFDSIVDVGGGTGTLAKAIADAFPHIHCTVLDLPYVVAGLHGTRNLKYVQGNMFEHIPPADAILMKAILHDWSDEESLEILKKCKDAIASKGKGGKLIIVDMVVDDQIGNNSNYGTQLFFDMLMLLGAGKERTEKEWAKLFLDAGFTNYKITSFSELRSIIEVYP